MAHHVIFSASVLVAGNDHAHEDVTLPIKKTGVTKDGRIRIEQGCQIGRAAVIRVEGELVPGGTSAAAARHSLRRAFSRARLIKSARLRQTTQ
jgi:hypothetical protein